ncbi:MAG: hypothetical protein D6815_10030 [Candidatus Dadabacteria bacterium]|nr:MAG: hypothetical protein D6815_10030 [Candidatus Dadabacteria bacterium]
MEAGIPPEWKRQWEQIVEQLHDPLKLRATVLGLLFVAGYLSIYRPLSGEIAILNRQLKEARTRLETIEKIELLQARRAGLRKKVPPQPTINYWSEHLIGGVRDSGVQLRSLETKPQKIKAGDLQVVYIDLEVEAQSSELYRLVRWVENNEWMMRIVRFRFKKEPDAIKAKLTVAILATQDKAHGA